MTPNGRRRNVWFPDDLWARVVRDAARETLESGERVTRADIIRRDVTKGSEEREACRDPESMP